MKYYNLERISILLIDDSSFMLSLLARVFHALGARTIHRASDGQEAIKLIKSLHERSGTTEGASPVDVIISDYFMEPFDGLMLLNWVRRSTESPDRFVPFVMISAAADRAVVAAARDAGASEFIAKPFSVNSKHEIETVYAGRVPKRADHAQIKEWRYELPNVLRRKVGVAADSEVATIDPNLIAAVESQIREMEEEYVEIVRSSIERLVQSYRQAVKAPDQATQHYQEINKVAHELRGQGGIFGYPLISRFAFSLYASTKGTPKATEKHLDLVKAHIDGIRVVMRDKVRGDGGPLGRELLAGLDKAKEKYQAG
jgi:CheY-like chemotaxis protein